MSFGKPFKAIPIRLGPSHRAQARRRGRVFAAKLLGGAALFGLGFGWLAAQDRSALLAQPEASAPAPAAQDERQDMPELAYYPNCGVAWEAGVAPLLKGQPGYRPELDRDSDGIACEPLPPPRPYRTVRIPNRL